MSTPIGILQAEKSKTFKDCFRLAILAGPKKGDNFRKKPTKEVNWKDILNDIEEFKYGHGGKLKRVLTDDRSKPMLAKTKKGGKVSHK